MAVFSVSSLYQFPRHCTPKAREIVLNIINSAQKPLATKDIYKLAVTSTPVSTSTVVGSTPAKSTAVKSNSTKSTNAKSTPTKLKSTTVKSTSAAEPFIPASDEPIRSLRYLKTVVLRQLASQNYIEKVRVRGVASAWLWRPKTVPPATPAKSTTPPSPVLPGVRELSPAAVGVGEDWSHLNKRRQRARQRKVERDLERMLELQKVQKKAALKAMKAGKAKSRLSGGITPIASSSSMSQPSV